MTGTTTNKTMPSRKRTSLAALSLVLTANSGLVYGFQSVNSRQGVPQSYVRQQHCGRQNSGQHHSSLPPPTVTALHISTPSASSIDSGEADITSGATGGDISQQQQQHQHQTQDVVATSAASESMEINSITSSSTGTKDEKKKVSKINKVEHAQNEITSADKAVLWTTIAGIVAAFAAVTQISGPGAWKYYVAGGICAAFSHGITTPIDVVKVTFTFSFVYCLLLFPFLYVVKCLPNSSHHSTLYPNDRQGCRWIPHSEGREWSRQQ